MTGKQKAIAIVGLAIVLFITLSGQFKPDGTKDDGFSRILYAWSYRQEEASEKITDAAVAPVEGAVIGTHLPNGANWSIPNIIRNLLGVK